jgi:hypothetical protein
MKCRLFVSRAIAAPLTFVCAHAPRRSYGMLVPISELLALFCIGCGGGMSTPPRALLSITVHPSNGNAWAPIGTLPFTAMGTFNQSPTTQTDFSVQWTSSDTSIASIDPNSGLATCVSVDAPKATVMITATADGKQGTAQLTCFSPEIPAREFGNCVSVCTVDHCQLTGYCSGVIDACYEGYDPRSCPVGRPAGKTATHGCGVPVESITSETCVP